jgi:gamma-glutamyltranspeptidase/glutathione hydrolase
MHELVERVHDVEILQQYDDAIGQAGWIVRRADGVFEGGADPRSDELVVSY